MVYTMKLSIFKVKYRSCETRNKISETMKQTGRLWRRYLELKPDGYNFDTCKHFRSYLKQTNDTQLIELLSKGSNV